MKKPKGKLGPWIALMFGLLIGVFLGGQLIFFTAIEPSREENTETSGKQTEELTEKGSREPDSAEEAKKEPEKKEGFREETDGRRSYFNSQGEMLRNSWVRVDGASYYADAEGHIVTGFRWVEGKLRYFEEDGRLREQMGWLYDNGVRYYIDAYGSVSNSGKLMIDDVPYYFSGTGALQTGRIQKDENTFYYAGTNGVLYTDQDFTLDGITYHADKESEVFTGTMYVKAQGYSSDTDYLIMCNLATQKTAVFEGKQGNWRLLREMIVSTGAPINPTPKGEYKTTIHTLHFNNYGVRAWYATGFIGGLYLFHSSPYEIDSEPKVCTDPRLGIPASHGCVRMALEDAKWMYELCPLRTKVVIYEE